MANPSKPNKPTGALFGIPAFFCENLSLGARDDAAPGLSPARVCFALVMIGLGIVGLIAGDFAEVWQHMPIKDLPGQKVLAYLCAALELMAGIGLLLAPVLTLTSRVLFFYMTLWVVLLKLPAVILVPYIEGTWSAFGEIAIIMAGAWALYARHAGPWDKAKLNWAVGTRGVRNARLLLSLSIPLCGLAHLVYSDLTAPFIPGWIPFHMFWVILTGSAGILAGFGILFGVYARLAAVLEAAMLGSITLLVWGPAVISTPLGRDQWTGFLISSGIAVGAWLVADTYRGAPWFVFGNPKR